MKVFLISLIFISSIVQSKIYQQNKIGFKKNLKISNKYLSKKMIEIELINLFNQKDIYKHSKHIKRKVLSYGAFSVPTLLKVMKEKKYSDKAKWIATFLLGRTAGTKSIGVLTKFTKHPNWVLRLASLRTLFSLNAKNLQVTSSKMLKDKSLLIRNQALDIITTYGFKKESMNVWSMLYDKRNYNKKSTSSLVRKIIRSIGSLKFKKALKPLLKMSQKDKYNSLFAEIDYSLSNITGKNSPKGNIKLKKKFWNSLKI